MRGGVDEGEVIRSGQGGQRKASPWTDELLRVRKKCRAKESGRDKCEMRKNRGVTSARNGGGVTNGVRHLTDGEI